MVAVVDHVPGGVIAQWAAGHMIILVEFYTYRNSLVAELIQRLVPAIPVAIVSVFIVNARTRPGISHVVYQPVEVVPIAHQESRELVSVWAPWIVAMGYCRSTRPTFI